MKKKELKSIRAKEEKEIKKILDDKRKSAVELYAKMKVGQEKNLRKVKMLRRDISQILTILREKEIKKGETKQ
jgi:ribosomal protein L29